MTIQTNTNVYMKRLFPAQLWRALHRRLHTGESARRLYQLGSCSVATSRHCSVAAKATVATLFCRCVSVRYGRRRCPASFGLIKVRKTAWKHGWKRLYLFRVIAIGGRSIWHWHCLARTSTSCHSTNTSEYLNNFEYSIIISPFTAQKSRSFIHIPIVGADDWQRSLAIGEPNHRPPLDIVLRRIVILAWLIVHVV